MMAAKIICIGSAVVAIVSIAMTQWYRIKERRKWRDLANKYGKESEA